MPRGVIYFWVVSQLGEAEGFLHNFVEEENRHMCSLLSCGVYLDLSQLSPGALPAFELPSLLFPSKMSNQIGLDLASKIFLTFSSMKGIELLIVDHGLKLQDCGTYIPRPSLPSRYMPFPVPPAV